METFHIYLNEKEVDKFFCNEKEKATVADIYHFLVDQLGYDHRIVVIKEVA